MKTLIKEDLYNISKRIKQIDNKYFLMFNYKTKKYELHYSRLNNTLELVLPFEFLDYRTLEYVNKTHIKNSNSIFAQIDKQNKKIEENLLQEKLNLSSEMFKEYLQYFEKII